jgi:hypothetical protein
LFGAILVLGSQVLDPVSFIEIEIFNKVFLASEIIQSFLILKALKSM